jgi:hypothetical protein
LPKHKESIESRLKQLKYLLETAKKDHNIKSELNSFGYSAKRMREGELLYEQAADLYKKKFVEYNLEKPDDFFSLWKSAYEYYLQLIHISRYALQSDRNAFIQLGLAGPRKTSLSGWLSQANQYYINALSNPTICEKLKEFGITKEKLENGKKQLDTVEVAIVSRNLGNGEFRKLSLEYDKAIDKMESWFATFNTVSRIIFENKPQLLNKLRVDYR